MNIGLMGGTFNPIHLAHLRIAEEARESLGLQRVVFIPAADPPHKPLAGEVAFSQRCEMVRRAISDNPAFEMSDIEGQRPGKSYSIDTISFFHERFPGDRLFFIVGSDSFIEIGLWHRYAEIFRACNLIVIERPGRPVADPWAALPMAVRAEFDYIPETHRLRHTSGQFVHFLKGCPLDISSTEIRQLVASERSITYLVPSTVEAYINTQRIYTECL
jgi:nicotinate-nucleotide adenylyltransferase